MKSLLRILPLFLILLSACTKENTASHTRKNPVEVAPIVEKRVFDYQPAKPINGQLNAVIELGALGLNYFIIKIDQNARWTLEKQNFGKSNIIYGGSKVGQIISDVQNFQKSIINYGVR
ncbi:MAG: hypothetical protein HRT61_17070, partial [Ekhidna sp.]|nr:hypothetical protein [Ekhidna sp.]